MSFVVLGYDDEAASLFVEAVNDAGTHLAAHRREASKMMQERVDQRPAIALVIGRAGAGVYHHAGALVDDCEVVIFVEDVEGDVFGAGAERRARGGAEDGDALAAAEFQRR